MMILRCDRSLAPQLALVFAHPQARSSQAPNPSCSHERLLLHSISKTGQLACRRPGCGALTTAGWPCCHWDSPLIQILLTV